MCVRVFMSLAVQQFLLPVFYLTRCHILCEAYEVGYCAKPTKQDTSLLLCEAYKVLCEAYEEGYCAKPKKQDTTLLLPHNNINNNHNITQILHLRTLVKTLLFIFMINSLYSRIVAEFYIIMHKKREQSSQFRHPLICQERI